MPSSTRRRTVGAKAKHSDDDEPRQGLLRYFKRAKIDTDDEDYVDGDDAASEEDEEDEVDEEVEGEVEVDDDDDDDDDDDVEMEDVVMPSKKSKGKGRKRGSTVTANGHINGHGAKKGLDSSHGPRKGLDTSLPPIPNVELAFDDIVRRATTKTPTSAVGAFGLDSIAAKGPFVMRFATMCSGTEAPLLALQMVQDAFFAQNAKELFRFEHIFSVEIVPFKQAYISRNTSATVFRDVCDFTEGETATTALGGEAQIPKGIDLLVAGTSCVDFSVLNIKKMDKWHPSIGGILKNKPKKGKGRFKLTKAESKLMVSCIRDNMDRLGESARTFFSMLSFAYEHRPKIVIIENVKLAPWQSTKDEWFPAIGYVAEYVHVDTKEFYMPQTRERGYLIAVDEYQAGGKAAEVVAKWAETVRKLSRKASSSIEEYLLPSTSRLTKLARQELEDLSQGRKRSDTPWAYSRNRHMQVRRTEELGQSRPLTRWNDNGSTKFYDRMDPMVMSLQPPRVWDCIDINYLRGLRLKPAAYDINFKTKMVDLSQNVDRNKNQTPFGITGCLTPSGIHYITDQQRMLTGFESLALQGLPLSRIDLSLETQDELKDLAGNAMSTTVVGAALVAAFLAYDQIHPAGLSRVTDDHADPFKPKQEPLVYDVRQRGKPMSINVAETANFSAGDIFELVARSRVYCSCHGTAKYSTQDLWQCRACKLIKCANCKGNPAHDYHVLSLVPAPMAEAETERRLMTIFPSVVTGLFDNKSLFEPGLRFLGPPLASSIFYFDGIYITETVAICFVASTGFRLNIICSQARIVWYLSLDRWSETGEMAARQVSELDDFCKTRRPLARAVVTENATSAMPQPGDWEIWRRCDADELEVVVQKMAGADGRDVVTITGESEDEELQRLINTFAGNYVHLPDCDAAENSLFSREADGQDQQQLFLFKDPTKLGNPDKDCFVISPDPRVLQAHEPRDSLVSFQDQIHKLGLGECKLRPSQVGYWDRVDGGKARRTATSEAVSKVTMYLPKPSAATLNCQTKHQLLGRMAMQRVGLANAGRVLPKLSRSLDLLRPDQAVAVDRHDLQDMFKVLAFANVKLMGKVTAQQLTMTPQLCHSCSIQMPAVHWLIDGSQQPEPRHKKDDIVEFEKALSVQHPIFQVQMRVCRQEGELWRLAVDYVFNPVALAHRALHHLPGVQHKLEGVESRAWTEPGHADSLALRLEPFRHSLGRVPTAQKKAKKGLLANLFETQKRSVSWMMEREREPKAFVEREIDEEVVDGLRLRLVGCAERTIKCGGGIIADDVGYGKTVISLALIKAQEQWDSDMYQQRLESEAQEGAVALPATLIIVPEHLVEQWCSEVKTHLRVHDDSYVVKISSASAQAVSLERLRAARIVMISDRFFTGNRTAYISRLSGWAGQICPWEGSASWEGHKTRSYQAWHDMCVASIRSLMGRWLSKVDAQGRPRAEARRAVAEEISARYEANVQLNRQLLLERKPQSSRKGKPKSGDDKTAKAKNGDDKAATEYSPVAGLEIKSEAMFAEHGFLPEFFSWNRVIWDEFSYENVPVAEFVKSAPSAHKWLLSATPPTRSLKNVCDMANAIGIHIARPIDLRLGLPRTAQGPRLGLPRGATSIPTRTELETIRQYGKLKSDKFVRERHEKGQEFVREFACANPSGTDHVRIKECVVVVSHSITEKGLYVVAQQGIRDATMDASMLPNKDEIEGRIEGETPGGVALATRALIHKACLKTADNAPPTAAALRKSLESFVADAAASARHLFEKAVWLAHRLPLCPKDDKAGNSHVIETTASLVELVEDLRLGSYDRFRGRAGYAAVANALFPSLGMEADELMAATTADDFVLSPDQLTKTLDVPDETTFSTIYLTKSAKEQNLLPRDLDGKPLAEAATMLDMLFTRRASSWKDYYAVNPDVLARHVPDVDMTDFKESSFKFASKMEAAQMMAKDMRFLAKDAFRGKPIPQGKDKLATALVQELNRLERARKSEVKRRSNDDDIVAAIEEQESWPRPMLVSECRRRRLKLPTTVAKMRELLKEDMLGTASYDKYVGRRLVLSTDFPKLATIKSVRGARLLHTVDDLKDTLNRLWESFDELLKLTNQLRLGDVYDDIEAGRHQELECGQCGRRARKHALYVVVECGHVLCDEHVNRELCGGDPDQKHLNRCPSILQQSAVPLSTLLLCERSLDFPARGRIVQPGHKSPLHLEDEDGTGKQSDDDEDEDAMDIDTAMTSPATSLSSKVRAIVSIISQVPHDEKVLLFAQHDEVLREMVEGLQECNISCIGFTDWANGRRMKAESVIERFKKGRIKVLAMKLNSVESAGSNLTVANHVIFASPLLVDCQQDYDAYMRQAQGRCVRYLQRNEVTIYHCITDRTIEVDILELRTRKHVLVQPGTAFGGLVARDVTPEKLVEDDGGGAADWLEENGWFVKGGGRPERVNSFLTTNEVWKAMEEEDYLTTIDMED